MAGAGEDWSELEVARWSGPRDLVIRAAEGERDEIEGGEDWKVVEDFLREAMPLQPAQ